MEILIGCHSKLWVLNKVKGNANIDGNEVNKKLNINIIKLNLNPQIEFIFTCKQNLISVLLLNFPIPKMVHFFHMLQLKLNSENQKTILKQRLVGLALNCFNTSHLQSYSEGVANFLGHLKILVFIWNLSENFEKPSWS